MRTFLANGPPEVEHRVAGQRRQTSSASFSWNWLSGHSPIIQHKCTMWITCMRQGWCLADIPVSCVQTEKAPKVSAQFQSTDVSPLLMWGSFPPVQFLGMAMCLMTQSNDSEFPHSFFSKWEDLVYFQFQFYVLWNRGCNTHIWFFPEKKKRNKI